MFLTPLHCSNSDSAQQISSQRVLFPEDLQSHKEQGDAQVQAHPLSLQGWERIAPCFPHQYPFSSDTLQGEAQLADKLQGENLLLVLSSPNFYA